MKITKTMIKENPVKAAMQLAQRALANDPEQAKVMLIEKRRELARLKELDADLLAIELNSSESLEPKIRVLKQDIKTLIGQLVPTPTSLPIFDLECLTWRDEKGFPRLVPFSLDDNKVSFLVRSESHPWSGTRTSNGGTRFPKQIADQYKDVFKTLREKRQRGKNIEIAATFGGAIPDHIRDLIQGARDAFDELRIVAEVSSWTIIEKNARPVQSRKGDPLLIGLDRGDYRLIAAFDTTSIEQIALERSKGRKQS